MSDKSVDQTGDDGDYSIAHELGHLYLPQYRVIEIEYVGPGKLPCYVELLLHKSEFKDIRRADRIAWRHLGKLVAIMDPQRGDVEDDLNDRDEASPDLESWVKHLTRQQARRLVATATRIHGE